MPTMQKSSWLSNRMPGLPGLGARALFSLVKQGGYLDIKDAWEKVLDA